MYTKIKQTLLASLFLSSVVINAMDFPNDENHSRKRAQQAIQDGLHPNKKRKIQNEAIEVESQPFFTFSKLPDDILNVILNPMCKYGVYSMLFVNKDTYSLIKPKFYQDYEHSFAVKTANERLHKFLAVAQKNEYEVNFHLENDDYRLFSSLFIFEDKFDCIKNITVYLTSPSEEARMDAIFADLCEWPLRDKISSLEIIKLGVNQWPSFQGFTNLKVLSVTQFDVYGGGDFPLGAFSNLRQLRVESLIFFDYLALRTLPYFERLGVYRLDDTQIEKIKEISSLKELIYGQYLGNSGRMEELKKALPGLIIKEG